MKKCVYLSLIILTVFLFGFSMIKEKYVDKWNVVLSVDNISSSEVSLRVLPQREHKESSIIHKHHYDIERLDNNGSWVSLSTIMFDYNKLVYDQAYEYKDGYTYRLDWSHELEELAKGTYRIAVNFTYLELGDNQRYERIDDCTYYVEFEI